MAKGLGQILAQIRMDETKRRLASLESIACPFCGQEMDNIVGNTWFCYGGPPHEEKCSMLPLIEYALGGSWEAQGRMVAAVVVGGKPVVEVYVLRGGGGYSNLSVSPASVIEAQEVPGLIAKHGWTFLDEVASLVKGG